MKKDITPQAPISLDSILRPTRDVVQAAKTLGPDEVRFIVDAYYQMQEYRKASGNQIRSLDQGADEGGSKAHATLDWLFTQLETMENQIKRALDAYTNGHIMGSWMREIYGIGPVISAGLLAHINIEKAPTVGHIWRYAGLDPTVSWLSTEKVTEWVREHGLDVEAAARYFGRNAENLRRSASQNKEGEPIEMTAKSLVAAIARRPWNAQLKTLCWKIGQSFMKFSNVEECWYGCSVYKGRKAFEIARNDEGGNAPAAALGAARVGKATEAYKYYSIGMLPPAQIDARARRYAVKLFLSHLHGEWYERHFGKPAPLPYPIAHLGHVHFIPAPGQRAA